VKGVSEGNGKSESRLGIFTRRKLFSALGFGSLFLSLGAIGTGVLAFIFPRLTFEPSSKVAIGRPQDFQPGRMKLISSAQIYVFHNGSGLQAVSGICTHLGCSYKPFIKGDPKKYGCGTYAHCPCHGSVFCRDGDNVAGPAPRPLPFYKMELSPDGRVVVDKGAVALTDDLSRASGEGVAHNLYLNLDTGSMEVGPYPTGEELDLSA